MSDNATPINRRQFLQRTFGGFAAAFTPAACTPKNSPTEMSKIFEGIPLTDQYGKSLNPAELFADKPCIVVFGFQGCTMCGTTPSKPGIASTVAAIQKRLLLEGRDVPIMVISVQPEDDKNQMPVYVTDYRSKGLRQFATDKLSTTLAESMADYHGASNKPQSSRNLHIVCPPSEQMSIELEKRIGAALTASGKFGLLYDEGDARAHTPKITLFNNGVVVQAFNTLNEDEPLNDITAKQVSEKLQSLTTSRNL